MKKLLLVLTILCIVLPSCKKTPIITLSVDKSEISANGVDVAKFKVICNDEDDVTQKAHIFFADTNKELTNKTFSTTEPKTYTFYATYDDATSGKVTVKAIEVIDDNDDNNDDNNDNDNDGDNDNDNDNDNDDNNDNDNDDVIVVELSVSKTSILADGEDAAVFNVTANGDALSENYQVLNVADSSLVENGTFVTTEAGNYTFVALYNEVYSNEVTIVAEAVETPDPVVELVADKTAIKNDGIDKITFTVLVDGEDRTAESVIIDVTSGGGVYEGGTTFSSEYAGDYAFKAKWNEYESEMVVINVYEPQAYAPGDLYDVNGVKGVVFYVDETGTSGLIMSMDQEYLQWSTVYEWANCLSNKGEWNTEDMLKLGADKYPAAKWCVEHGEGWYMPSSYEMNLMWAAVSDGKLDFDHEFVKLYNDKLEDPIIEDYYWSSSEISEDMAEVVVFIDDSVVCLEPKKDRYFHVRAIRKF